MKMITRIAVSALVPAFMVAAATPAAAQNIVSPPPGTNVTIAGIIIVDGITGPGATIGGPGNPGCPLILNGKVLSATPGVIQIDSVISCKVFTVPIFFRFTTASSGKIDRLEAVGLAPSFPTTKCGASNVLYGWTNPRFAHVPHTIGTMPPGIPVCSFTAEFTFSPDIIVN